MMQIINGSNYTYLTSKQTFSNFVNYTCSFDMNYALYNNNDGRDRIDLPGGLSIGLMSWDNGTIIWYDQTNTSTSSPTIIAQLPGGHMSQWAHYEVSVLGKRVLIKRNGTAIYDAIQAVSPNFSKYPVINLVGWGDAPNAHVDFDNIILEQ